MFADRYSGAKVFITGNTGFKGSWLSAWLLSLGASVTGFANSVPSQPSCFEALGLSSRIKDIRGDVRDGASLQKALLEAQPDFIFHLAAQPLVRESYADPVNTFSTNILGVVNLLQAARFCPSARAIIVITSDKCYRNDEWVYGYRETDYLGGKDPYSASKASAEIVAHSYFDSFFQTGPACATTRAGNVIGGGDWAKDRIVPDCARAWHNGTTVPLRSPKATRPWQHVLEPLSGYLWLGARLTEESSGQAGIYDLRGQAYNFGPPSDAIHSVSEVVQELKRHWSGFDYAADPSGCGVMKECGLLKLCCDKANAELNWKAVLDFEETLRYTAEWYGRFYADEDHKDGAMWDYTLGQIKAYTHAAQARGLDWAIQ